MTYDRIKDAEDTDIRRTLRVTKNRLWGKLGEIDLYYSEESRRTSEREDDFRRDYLSTNEDAWQEVTESMDELPF